MAIFKKLLLVTAGAIVIAYSQGLLAHSEPDKARYVAENGADKGFCDNPLRPCKSIAYAVQRANKGDKVLVASGNYEITSPEEIFYLKSEIVPILAGFNRYDHFQTQSPAVNSVYIRGVPFELIPTLEKKGFRVLRDGKSYALDSGLQKKLDAVKGLSEKQADVACVEGDAAGFPCENIDLVAHIPLSEFSGSQSSANDIWGHVDLNTGTEYAIIGLQKGVAVMDLADPENPREVGVISGGSSSWRDVKVYQFFDRQSFRWKAYAYSTVDNRTEGVTIIDLNSLPDSISMVERNDSVDEAHNVYISNIDHSLNIKYDDATPSLQLVGAKRNGGRFNSGAFNSYSLSDPRTISSLTNQGSFGGYTHDGASMVIDDSRKDSDCVNTSTNCSVFIDFNEKEMVLWDISDPIDSLHLSTTTYNDVAPENQYVHSGWPTDDNRHIFLHDEFDEQRAGINTTVRIFQIDNLRAPVQVGQWTGPTAAIDHNGFVRGNRYYMSNYQRGLTVLDISDPANPTQVGFFDTFPSSNSASYNGAWGTYPYLPSGLILVSDINSGLYILRDKTQATIQGNIHLSADEASVERGTEATITVSRNDVANSATSVTVKYQVISGSASKGSDFTAASGTLEWTGNDASDKTFNITIAPDPGNEQFTESLFVKLYDPTSGAVLTSPSYLELQLNGVPNSGSIELSQQALIVAENSGEVTIEVNRAGGFEGAASVDYSLSAASATLVDDFTDTSGTLNWADGETGVKTFTVNIVDDFDDENDETFEVLLSNFSGANEGASSTLTVTISDDDSNTAPVVTVADDFEVNTLSFVEIGGEATDAESDPLSYEWTQTAGTTVTLSDADQVTANFVAPNIEGDLEFQLTVTDNKGGASSDTLVVTVIAPPPVPEAESSSGGGSFGWILLLTLVVSGARRNKLI